MSVTLHTNLGDIKCEIFCDEVPKTSERHLIRVKALAESVKEMTQLLKKLYRPRQDDDDFQQSITKFLNDQEKTPTISIINPSSIQQTKFLKDQEKTPTISTLITSGIQQTEDDVISLNVDNSSLIIIIDHPNVEIVPMQVNAPTNQPHVGDNSTRSFADFPKTENFSFPETVQEGLFHHFTTPTCSMIVPYAYSTGLGYVSSVWLAHQMIFQKAIVALPSEILVVMPFDRGKFGGYQPSSLRASMMSRRGVMIRCSKPKRHQYLYQLLIRCFSLIGIS